ncbi:STN domain-containing protein [Caulobacter segnis]
MRISLRNHDTKSCLMIAAGAAALLAATEAHAQVRKFDVPEQPAATGIPQFGKQAELQILAPQGAVQGKRVNAVRGAYTVEDGLARLLRGADLTVVSNNGRTAVLGQTASLQLASTGATPLIAAQAAAPSPPRSPRPPPRSRRSSSPASAPACRAP